MINNILVLDGGGIRGIITARILIRVEKKLQQLASNFDARLADYFDFFVGTSTGGLLAYLYLTPNDEGTGPRYSAEEVEEAYIMDGGVAFTLNRMQKALRHGITAPKYPAAPAEEVFQKYCGDVRLGQLIRPYLATAYDMLSNDYFLFRQYRAQHNPAEDFYMRDVCRATTSAPTYFPPAEVLSLAKKEHLFIDGGVYACNPSLLAYAEIRRLVPDRAASNMYFLSIGTGKYHEIHNPKELKKWGKLEWSAPLIQLMYDCSVRHSHLQMKAVFHDCPERYLRLDPQLPDEDMFKLDLASKENIAKLVKLADDYIQARSARLDAFAERIYASKQKVDRIANGRILDLWVKPYWRQSYPPDTPPTINADAYANLPELIEESCAKFATRIAYDEFGCSMTYAEVHQNYHRLAAWLQQHGGLKLGDRVAIMMPNCSQYPLSVFATLAAGGAVVNVNPLYTSAELEDILRIAKPKVMIIWNGALPVLRACRADLQPEHLVVTGLSDMLSPIKRHLINTVLRLQGKVRGAAPAASISFRRALRLGADCSFYQPRIASRDLAFLQFTGGTTGTPKAVILTHRNLIANIMQCRYHVSPAFCDPEAEQRITLTALPLYHIFALMANGLFFFYLGTRNVLVANPRDLKGLIKTMRAYAFHGIDAVNTLFKALLAHPQFAELDFSKLIISLGGGMAVNAQVAEDWHKVTGSVLREGYGLTETSPVIAINPHHQTRFSGSIGLPVPSTLAVILDEKTLSPLPPKEIGLLFVRGPQVMAGYWQEPQETAKDLSLDGWLNTGDMGYMDDKGYIFLVDRAKDVIIVSGFNVYPTEVEDVANKHPAVAESGCIGIKNAQDEEEVHIFVVLKEGQHCTADELLAHCRKSLTAYKIPRHVTFVDVVPKTPVGKILRRALPDLLKTST